MNIDYAGQRDTVCSFVYMLTVDKDGRVERSARVNLFVQIAIRVIHNPQNCDIYNTQNYNKIYNTKTYDKIYNTQNYNKIYNTKTYDKIYNTQNYNEIYNETCNPPGNTYTHTRYAF
nr:hypothetical protein BaRGS_022713 [Batillaria attramentaria]